MGPLEQYVANLAKEITIAKLSNSSPGSTKAESGELIGEMYLAIYNKILNGFKGTE